MSGGHMMSVRFFPSERIEMMLAPAPGVEAGALATEMDIVIG